MNREDSADHALDDRGDQTVSPIARRLSLEFDGMNELLDGYGVADVIDVISVEMNSQLRAIAGLIGGGHIHPQYDLRLSQAAPRLALSDRPLRIGIFPTAADPFHWMHLLSGLWVMARYELDKVVYVISGSDARKPELLRADIRHTMGQNILRLFSPLFAYSPIAMGNTLDGEINLFRILQLNPGQRVDAFYIAGSDHYNRYNPQTGSPDTIQKLEDGVEAKLFGYDARMSSISAVFLGRGEQALKAVGTFLTTGSAGRMPIDASSTSIRNALVAPGTFGKLATLPYSAFRFIRKLALYSHPRFPAAHADPPQRSAG